MTGSPAVVDSDGLSAIERQAFLQAMVLLAGERGYVGVSVAQITERAGLPRRLFFSHYSTVEDCFLAVLDLGLEQTAAIIRESFEPGEAWQDGLCRALALLLLFEEAEPPLARVCLVESLSAGPRVLQTRQEHLRRIRNLVMGCWPTPGAPASPPQAAELVMSAVMGVVTDHFVLDLAGRTLDLLGPLMGAIVGPFLGSAAARAAIDRGNALARAITAGETQFRLPWEERASLPIPLPKILANPMAIKARQCLMYLAMHSDASNHDIASALSILHASQMSRLLHTLANDGFVVIANDRIGGANRCQLTPQGVATANVLLGH